MTSKKPHPIFSKVKKKETTKPRHKKWLVAILLLPIVIIGYLFWSQPSSDTTVTPMVAPPTLAEQNEAARAAEPSIEDISADNNAINNPTDEDITDKYSIANSTILNEDEAKTAIPSPKAIINAPIPETDALAKEEIDRLADERQRLKEQEQIALEQVEMTKSLTQMKAEQIDLLEQQIAELEAQQASN